MTLPAPTIPTHLGGRDKFGGDRAPPGRPYGVRNEAARIVRQITMKPLGAGKMVNDLVGGIRAALQKEMDDAKLEIAGEVTALLTEVRQGKAQVIKIVRDGVQEVRDEFGALIGNATDAADEVAADARNTLKAAQQAAMPAASQLPAAKPQEQKP